MVRMYGTRCAKEISSFCWPASNWPARESSLKKRSNTIDHNPIDTLDWLLHFENISSPQSRVFPDHLKDTSPTGTTDVLQ